MNNLPNWLANVQKVWIALGTLLAVLGGSGLIPDIVSDIISEEVWNALLAAIGAASALVQLIRSKFNNDMGEVQILSRGAKVRYMLNPFRTRIG